MGTRTRPFGSPRNVALALVVLAAAAMVWARATFSDRFFLSPESAALTSADVRIQFWYGPTQAFGQKGNPQRWINVLGNIQPAEEVRRATFSVNGGQPRTLALGGDLHRLALAGDFNAELSWDDVDPGENVVTVEATLRNGAVAREDLTLVVGKGNSLPLPHRIDFSELENLQDEVQVVDGHWRLDPDGIRTTQRYYDRVLSFGDTTWTDYEVSVRLTVHDFTPPEPSPPTFNVTHFGVAMRWRGHHADGLQPSQQWGPLGAQGELLVKTSPDSARWRILFDQAQEKPPLYSEKRNTLPIGQPIRIKTQVVTLPDGRSRYRFKQWTDGQPEPSDWDVEGFEADDYSSGSVCLVPHHTDVTIHEVRVEPVSRVERTPRE